MCIRDRFPPEYWPWVPPACADQPQACEGRQGPSAPADCVPAGAEAVSYTHLRAHETSAHL
eukprot:12935849-Alexandrium_andersonii.AAC.1